MALLAFPHSLTSPRRWPAISPVQLVLILLGLILLMQVELAFTKNVNWDEFFHYSEINQARLGRPVSWLQTPYVTLFRWVPALGGGTISQIQLIRLLLLPFELATLAAIFLTARYFASLQAALLCLLAYATGGYVFTQALALRGDMIAAALLTSALCIAITRALRPRECAAITLLLVLAFITTIKSVLYTPAFVGVAFCRLENATHRKALVASIIIASAAAIALLAGADALPDNDAMHLPHDVADLGRRSVDRMFTGGLFPQRRYLFEQLLFAPILSALVCVAFVSAWRSKRRVLLLALLAPLCTVAIYRNSFPYHYVFILPPAIIACAPAADRIVRRYGLALISILLTVNAAALSFREDRGILTNQKIVERGLTDIFPKPVSYIDDCGMMGTYPRAVPHFASGWALAEYRSRGRPEYRKALEIETVPLLIANGFGLQDIFHDNGHDEHLLPADEQVLKNNYIHHWGIVYVAGKEIPATAQPTRISILIPGNYTLEGGDVVIDGSRRRTGEVMELVRGTHEIGATPIPVRLRWGDHLRYPSFSGKIGLLFTDF